MLMTNKDKRDKNEKFQYRESCKYNYGVFLFFRTGRALRSPIIEDDTNNI